MSAANALAGSVVWLVVVLGVLILVGLAALWVRILRWAFRVSELVDIASDTLHELRIIRTQMTGTVVRETDATIRSAPDAPHGAPVEDVPKTCPRCRLANSPGETHCEKCGAPL